MSTPCPTCAWPEGQCQCAPAIRDVNVAAAERQARWLAGNYLPVKRPAPVTQEAPPVPKRFVVTTARKPGTCPGCEELLEHCRCAKEAPRTFTRVV
jgi:hypothetical protein